MHTRLISYSAIAPTSTGAAAAAVAGDSLVIENNQGNDMRPSILRVWGMNQTAGFHQISFPSGHDTLRGYRYGVPADETSFRLPRLSFIPLTAQEQLSVTIAGSATAGDVEMGSALIFYPNVPGVGSRGISSDDVFERLEKMTTISGSIQSVSNVYTELEINNSTFGDLLLANRDYAILGMETGSSCLAGTFRAPDTGNVRVGVPGGGGIQNFDTNFFLDLANDTKLPVVPVFNSGNRNNSFLGVIANETAPLVQVTAFLALLAPKKKAE